MTVSTELSRNGMDVAFEAKSTLESARRSVAMYRARQAASNLRTTPHPTLTTSESASSRASCSSMNRSRREMASFLLLPPGTGDVPWADPFNSLDTGPHPVSSSARLGCRRAFGES